MTILIIVIIWLIGGTITASGTCAYLQKEFPTSAEKYYREDLAFGIFFGFIFLLPITWFIFLFLTGFYKHGFSLKKFGGLKNKEI